MSHIFSRYSPVCLALSLLRRVSALHHHRDVEEKHLFILSEHRLTERDRTGVATRFMRTSGCATNRSLNVLQGILGTLAEKSPTRLLSSFPQLYSSRNK